MSKDRRRKRNRLFIICRKARDKCVRCGTKRNLTYHHRDPGKKLFNISEAPRLKVSLDKLQAEFNKCDALCSRCHTLEHNNVVLPPFGFSSAEFSVSTLTDGGFVVIVVHATTQMVYVGEHPTSRRLAHDQAIELFLEDMKEKCCEIRI